MNSPLKLCLAAATLNLATFWSVGPCAAASIDYMDVLQATATRATYRNDFPPPDLNVYDEQGQVSGPSSSAAGGLSVSVAGESLAIALGGVGISYDQGFPVGGTGSMLATAQSPDLNGQTYVGSALGISEMRVNFMQGTYIPIRVIYSSITTGGGVVRYRYENGSGIGANLENTAGSYLTSNTSGQFTAEVLAATDVLSGPFYSDALAIMTWGLEGFLPGTDKTRPLLPDAPPPGGFNPPTDSGVLSQIPSNVGGAFSGAGISSFTTPVLEDYGRTSPLYFDPVWSSSYLYTVTDNFFTSVIIPDPVPGGDTEFELRFGPSGEFLSSLTAGTTFDFTSFVPGGISWFILSGVDLDAPVDPDTHPPFVTGLTFANDGIETLRIRALDESAASPVPEPASLALLIAGAPSLLISWRRRRRNAANSRLS